MQPHTIRSFHDRFKSQLLIVKQQHQHWKAMRVNRIKTPKQITLLFGLCASKQKPIHPSQMDADDEDAYIDSTIMIAISIGVLTFIFLCALLGLLYVCRRQRQLAQRWSQFVMDERRLVDVDCLAKRRTNTPHINSPSNCVVVAQRNAPNARPSSSPTPSDAAQPPNRNWRSP